MDDLIPPHPALLPAGLRDLLPPDALTEASAVERLMAIFASHGFARVKPPMMEFEENLLSGAGAAIADQSFRLMDPDSHRMMALRADMTPQIARIAATRLAEIPRRSDFPTPANASARASGELPTGRCRRPALNFSAPTAPPPTRK